MGEENAKINIVFSLCTCNKIIRNYLMENWDERVCRVFSDYPRISLLLSTSQVFSNLNFKLVEWVCKTDFVVFIDWCGSLSLLFLSEERRQGRSSDMMQWMMSWPDHGHQSSHPTVTIHLHHKLEISSHQRSFRYLRKCKCNYDESFTLATQTLTGGSRRHRSRNNSICCKIGANSNAA